MGEGSFWRGMRRVPLRLSGAGRSLAAPGRARQWGRRKLVGGLGLSEVGKSELLYVLD